MASVLTGSHATRKRHLRQAKAIQAAIANRWHRENPWTWQQKHLEWFLTMQTHQNAQTTRSYYLRTARWLSLALEDTGNSRLQGRSAPDEIKNQEHQIVVKCYNHGY